MSGQESMQDCFSKMADDFFILTILSKITPENTNETLPWFFSHIIELALKTCCIKFDKPSQGHILYNLWNQIKENFLEKDIWPGNDHFEKYKKIFIRGDASDKTIRSLPKPDDLYKTELAYWIDNIRDLKYGFDLKATRISMISLSYTGMNLAFLKLFKTLRDKYKNKNLDERYIKKIKSLFPNLAFQEETIRLLID